MTARQAYQALTSRQPSRMNEAWAEGWRNRGDYAEVRIVNVRTGEELRGYRIRNSKRIQWI